MEPAQPLTKRCTHSDALFTAELSGTNPNEAKMQIVIAFMLTTFIVGGGLAMIRIEHAGGHS